MKLEAVAFPTLNNKGFFNIILAFFNCSTDLLNPVAWTTQYLVTLVVRLPTSSVTTVKDV